MRRTPDLLSPNSSIVIVGAGLAGVRAAEGARAAGFKGRVVLIDSDTCPPYDRPPLSKDVLTTHGEEDRISLLDDESVRSLEIDLRLETRVEGINKSSRTVRLSSGQFLKYDVLILATGSSARSLDCLPADHPRILHLRTMNDALRLRNALDKVRDVAIIGGGVIGLEVAASASKLGKRLTVVEAAPMVMARSAAPVVSQFLADQHRSRGVEILTNCSVNGVEDIGDQMRLHLSHDTLDVDAVVVGVGVQPNTGLAEQCGVATSPAGIIVDGWGRTSEPGILAAGECTYHLNTMLNCHMRQETWAHAAAHGDHVGRFAATGDAGGDAYAELPSYWSDQFDISLQCVGSCNTDRHVVRGDVDGSRFTVFHLSGRKIVGASVINSAREVRLVKKLIKAGAEIPDTDLADLRFDLAAVAA